MKKYLTTIIMLISVLASYGQDKILFLGKNEFYPKLPNEKWYIYINTKEDEIELHESIAIPVDIIKYKTIYKFGNGATFVFLESNVQSISPNVTVEDFTKFKYGKCFIVGTGGMCYVWTKDIVLPISILDKDVHTKELATLITVLYPPKGNSGKSSTLSSNYSSVKSVEQQRTYNKKGGFYYSGTYLDSPVATKRVHSFIKKDIDKWKQCKVAGINPKGAGVAIYGTNGYAYESKTDEDLKDAIVEEHDKKYIFIDVNITESGKYCFIYGRNGWHSKGAPAAFSERINTINNNHGSILSACFNDKGKWAVITSKENYGDSETMAFINKAKQKYGGVLSVFLSEEGKVACCVRGVYFENIPKNVLERLKVLQFKPSFVKFTDDGLCIITNKNGNYWYFL